MIGYEIRRPNAERPTAYLYDLNKSIRLARSMARKHGETIKIEWSRGNIEIRPPRNGWPIS